MRYRCISSLRAEYSVVRLCGLLGVSRSSWYVYQAGLDRFSLGVNSLEKRVVALFGKHKRRYGTRRLAQQLRKEGERIGRTRIRRIMAKNKLVAIQPRSFIPRTTQSHPHLRRSPNVLLDRDFPSTINEVWVGDITYLPWEGEGWLYLAVWMDLCSRYIVGWQIEQHMEESLIIGAFRKALRARKPPKGLIVHSDGGGQYASINFRQLLTQTRCQQSMTRKNDHYDNAFIESHFSRFKAELLQGGVFASLEDARTEVFDYIEAYYNTIRLHSGIDYQSPLEFERGLAGEKKKDVL